jgi:hypothetical protein
MSPHPGVTKVCPGTRTSGCLPPERGTWRRSTAPTPDQGDEPPPTTTTPINNLNRRPVTNRSSASARPHTPGLRPRQPLPVAPRPLTGQRSTGRPLSGARCPPVRDTRVARRGRTYRSTVAMRTTLLSGDSAHRRDRGNATRSVTIARRDRRSVKQFRPHGMVDIPSATGCVDGAHIDAPNDADRPGKERADTALRGLEMCRRTRPRKTRRHSAGRRRDAPPPVEPAGRNHPDITDPGRAAGPRQVGVHHRQSGRHRCPSLDPAPVA